MPYPPFVVHGSDAGVERWSSQRLPFEPKGWMLEYRSALREALGRLDPARGPVLIASFASTDRKPCDVENLLLYNLGLSALSNNRGCWRKDPSVDRRHAAPASLMPAARCFG